MFVRLRRAAHYTCVSLLALAASAVGPREVVAQDSAGVCSRIADAAERLACYDRAAPPAADPATPDAGAKPAVSSRAARRADRASATSAAEGAPSATASAAAPDDDANLSVVVVSMRKLPGRSASFTTDTGEVWVQIGAEGVYVPKVPFAAELRQASMGTYFLRPSEYGWRVHVRRND